MVNEVIPNLSRDNTNSARNYLMGETRILDDTVSGFLIGKNLNLLILGEVQEVTARLHDGQLFKVRLTTVSRINDSAVQVLTVLIRRLRVNKVHHVSKSESALSHTTLPLQNTVLSNRLIQGISNTALHSRRHLTTKTGEPISKELTRLIQATNSGGNQGTVTTIQTSLQACMNSFSGNHCRYSTKTRLLTKPTNQTLKPNIIVCNLLHKTSDTVSTSVSLLIERILIQRGNGG